jgi:hypothetical protein
MAEPADEITGGRGHLRASDADREEVIEALKTAFVHGRLPKDEFDARTAQAFAARTYAELGVAASLTAGPAELGVAASLTAGPATAPRPRKAGQPGRPVASQPAANTKFRAGLCVVIISAAVVGAVPAAFPDNAAAFMAVLLAAFTGYVALVVTLPRMLASWHQKRCLGGTEMGCPGRG